MATNKTTETNASVDDYLAAIEDPTRRADCIAIADMMAKASKEPPKMWGPAIVGFGTHHYRYDSGREGDICKLGFSARKGNIAVYLSQFPEREQLMAKLGKHKEGKGCLNIKTLADVDLKVFKLLLSHSLKALDSA